MALDGEKLKNIRISKGMSQEKLAIMCNVNKRTIQRAEKGDPISLDTAAFIAEAIEIPLTTLRSNQLEFFEVAKPKAWDDVVLVPVHSGRRIIETLQKSFKAIIQIEIEPTKEIIGPLKRVVSILEAFDPDPWRPWHEREDHSRTQVLVQQAELNEALPDLVALGAMVFLGVYVSKKQLPTFALDDPIPYVSANHPFEEVEIAVIVVSDTSASHLIKHAVDAIVPDEEIPF